MTAPFRRIANATLTAGVAMAAVLSTPAPAAASHSESMQALQGMVYRANELGYTCRNQAQGEWIDEDESSTYPVTLSGSHEYVILAAGDSTTEDLDLELFDENFNLVWADDMLDSQPYVRAAPRWTGTFFVRMTMFSGWGNANFAVCYR